MANANENILICYANENILICCAEEQDEESKNLFILQEEGQ